MVTRCGPCGVYHYWFLIGYLKNIFVSFQQHKGRCVHIKKISTIENFFYSVVTFQSWQSINGISKGIIYIYIYIDRAGCMQSIRCKNVSSRIIDYCKTQCFIETIIQYLQSLIRGFRLCASHIDKIIIYNIVLICSSRADKLFIPALFHINSSVVDSSHCSILIIRRIFIANPKPILHKVLKAFYILISNKNLVLSTLATGSIEICNAAYVEKCTILWGSN